MGGRVYASVCLSAVSEAHSAIRLSKEELLLSMYPSHSLPVSHSSLLRLASDFIPLFAIISAVVRKLFACVLCVRKRPATRADNGVLYLL